MILLSIFFLLILSILFFPAASRPLAWTMLVLSITLILIAVVGRQVRLYKQGKLTRPQLAARIGFEVTGVLLCALAVVLAAGYAAWLVTRLLGVDGSSAAGRVIPLGVSLLVGLPLGWLFQKLWGVEGIYLFLKQEKNHWIQLDSILTNIQFVIY